MSYLSILRTAQSKAIFIKYLMINVRRNWDKLQNEEIEKKNCGKDLDRTEQRIVTLKKGRSGDKKDGVRTLYMWSRQ